CGTNSVYPFSISTCWPAGGVAGRVIGRRDIGGGIRLAVFGALLHPVTMKMKNAIKYLICKSNTSGGPCQIPPAHPSTSPESFVDHPLPQSPSTSAHSPEPSKSFEFQTHPQTDSSNATQ